MKKLCSLACALLVAGSMSAQFTETMKRLDIFNHLGVAVGIGTPGITIEAGTTITPWVQFRAGADIMPKFKMKTSLDLEEYDVAGAMSGMPTSVPKPSINEVDVEGKLTNTLGHILFDVFPFGGRSSFHVTVGGYFGGRKVISAYNTSGQSDLKEVWMYNHRQGQYSMVPPSEGMIGAALGNYFIEPDQEGNLNASIKVQSFRPYVGIGFGRIVPKKRFSCLFDLGVQFWGKPQVWNDTNHERLTSEGADGDDGGVLKVISKISVYPVISVKFVGKIL